VKWNRLSPAQLNDTGSGNGHHHLLSEQLHEAGLDQGVTSRTQVKNVAPL
jgi:hypothetical protein